MGSLLLKTATDLMIPILLLGALFLLGRGHNAPGGGFVAGLVAAAAIALHALAYNPASALGILRVHPRYLIGIGLAIAVLSGVLGIFYADPFLTGVWYEFTIGEGARLKVGTPLLFDVGVFLVVVGVAVTLTVEFAER